MSNFFSYLSWFQIALLMVGLMSGFLSLFREVLLIWHPDRLKSGNLFWRCTLISFILSSAILWMLEHKSVLEKQTQLEALTVPHFWGVIDYVSVFPKDMNDPQLGTIVLVVARIKNDGAPSIAEFMPLKVILKTGKEIELVAIAVPAQGVAVKPERSDGPTRAFYFSSYLPARAISQPIVTGGAATGWEWGLAQDASKADIDDPDSIVILNFTDIKNHTYEMKRRIGDPEIKIIDPGLLQKNN
jgi:hypothetical protein